MIAWSMISQFVVRINPVSFVIEIFEPNDPANS